MTNTETLINALQNDSFTLKQVYRLMDAARNDEAAGIKKRVDRLIEIANLTASSGGYIIGLTAAANAILHEEKA